MVEFKLGLMRVRNMECQKDSMPRSSASYYEVNTRFHVVVIALFTIMTFNNKGQNSNRGPRNREKGAVR